MCVATIQLYTVPVRPLIRFPFCVWERGEGEGKLFLDHVNLSPTTRDGGQICVHNVYLTVCVVRSEIQERKRLFNEREGALSLGGGQLGGYSHEMNALKRCVCGKESSSPKKAD